MSRLELEFADLYKSGVLFLLVTRVGQSGQMCRDVLLDHFRVVEGGVANDTLEVDHGVDSAVVDERVLAPERHAAHVALELAQLDAGRRLGRIVTAHVSSKVVAEQERAAAHLARVRAESRVRRYVSCQLKKHQYLHFPGTYSIGIKEKITPTLIGDVKLASQ